MADANASALHCCCCADPWNAARWTAEAEKLQKAEEEANERYVLLQAMRLPPYLPL